MVSKTELLEKIKALQRRHKTLLIGIDGYGGSGKTTIAELLKDNLHNAVIVQMDDFYSPRLKRPDYERVNRQVLEPLIKDTKASYQVYNWVKDDLEDFIDIEPGGSVIVEGVFSTHNTLESNYDCKIWVECPPEVGAKRGIDRDKERDGVDNTDKWLNLWMPTEREYFESQKPKERADYIVSGIE